MNEGGEIEVVKGTERMRDRFRGSEKGRMREEVWERGRVRMRDGAEHVLICFQTVVSDYEMLLTCFLKLTLLLLLFTCWKRIKSVIFSISNETEGKINL